MTASANVDLPLPGAPTRISSTFLPTPSFVSAPVPAREWLDEERARV
jgi:hypothetical protein